MFITERKQREKEERERERQRGGRARRGEREREKRKDLFSFALSLSLFALSLSLFRFTLRSLALRKCVRGRSRQRRRLRRSCLRRRCVTCVRKVLLFVFRRETKREVGESFPPFAVELVVVVAPQLFLFSLFFALVSPGQASISKTEHSSTRSALRPLLY